MPIASSVLLKSFTATSVEKLIRSPPTVLPAVVTPLT
jgi:hypothetical protein